MGNDQVVTAEMSIDRMCYECEIGIVHRTEIKLLWKNAGEIKLDINKAIKSGGGIENLDVFCEMKPHTLNVCKEYLGIRPRLGPSPSPSRSRSRSQSRSRSHSRSRPSRDDDWTPSPCTSGDEEEDKQSAKLLECFATLTEYSSVTQNELPLYKEVQAAEEVLEAARTAWRCSIKHGSSEAAVQSCIVCVNKCYDDVNSKRAEWERRPSIHMQKAVSDAKDYIRRHDITSMCVTLKDDDEKVAITTEWGNNKSSTVRV